MWTLLLLSACGQSDLPSQDPAGGKGVSTTVPAGTEASAESSSADDTSSGDPSLAQAILSDLDDWETELVSGLVTEVRSGVQLYDEEESFGLCYTESKRNCDVFVGLNPGLLPHGTFFIRALVKAPSVAPDWRIELEHSCAVSQRDGSEIPPKPKTRIYPVKHKLSRAYPVRMPSYVSPSQAGDEECTVKLFSLRPDGEQRTLLAEGAFSLPGKGTQPPDLSDFLAKFQEEETESAVATKESSETEQESSKEQP